MLLDGRTLLFSTSITLVILAVILGSMRRTMQGAAMGLGHFALANLAMTAACVLLSLRGMIPDWASLLVGNTMLVAGTTQYFLAVRTFDGDQPPAALAWSLPLVTCGYLAVFIYLHDSQPARVIGMMLAIIATTTGGGWSLIRQGERRSWSRIITGGSFLVVALAASVRLGLVLAAGAGQAALYSQSGSVLFVAACVVSLTSAVGFILMVSERLREQLAHAATHDALTGVLSRGAFMELAGRELARAHRAGHALALILADLDHFKRINDRYGHQVGDRALVAFARVTEGALRRSDSLGRYGGEEFIGLLTDVEREDASQAADRLRRAVEAEAVPSGQGPFHQTCSIGLADTHQFGYELETLVAAADRALYQAKRTGRNRVVVADMCSILEDEMIELAPTPAASPVAPSSVVTPDAVPA